MRACGNRSKSTSAIGPIPDGNEPSHACFAAHREGRSPRQPDRHRGCRCSVKRYAHVSTYIRLGRTRTYWRGLNRQGFKVLKYDFQNHALWLYSETLEALKL